LEFSEVNRAAAGLALLPINNLAAAICGNFFASRCKGGLVGRRCQGRPVTFSPFFTRLLASRG